MQADRVVFFYVYQNVTSSLIKKHKNCNYSVKNENFGKKF